MNVNNRGVARTVRTAVAAVAVFSGFALLDLLTRIGGSFDDVMGLVLMVLVGLVVSPPVAWLAAACADRWHQARGDRALHVASLHAIGLGLAWVVAVSVLRGPDALTHQSVGFDIALGAVVVFVTTAGAVVVAWLRTRDATVAALGGATMAAVGSMAAVFMANPDGHTAPVLVLGFFVLAIIAGAYAMDPTSRGRIDDPSA